MGMTNEIKVVRYYSIENATYMLKVTNNGKFVTCFLNYEGLKAESFARNLAEKLKQKQEEEETILTITI